MSNNHDHMDDELENLEEDISQEPEKLLSLTRNEALFIDDSLTMIIERDIGDDRLTTVRPLSHTAGLPAPVDLLEKIAMAILFTTEPENTGKEADVYVSDTDLYMLREIAHSYIKVGGEYVGYNLKRKLYLLLYQKSYDIDRVANNILSQVDFSIPLIEDTKSATEIQKPIDP